MQWSTDGAGFCSPTSRRNELVDRGEELGIYLNPPRSLPGVGGGLTPAPPASAMASQSA